MIDKISYYFSSLDAFVEFLYGLRRRVLERYYRFFCNFIAVNLEKFAKKSILNSDFSANLKRIIYLPIDLKISAVDLTIVKNEVAKTTSGWYNLLGSGYVELNPIVWDCDFKSSFSWPSGLFYKSYKQEGIDSESDVKVPRELSRCHHFLKLGVLYKETHEETHVRFCIDQMIDWIHHNPLMRSINWGCTMDVSIRAVNWIWTLRLLSESTNISEKELTLIKVSLYEHGWFIFRNPEKELYNNHNHYLADLAGQIHLGLLFSDLKEPKLWLEKGKSELFHEIRLQILPTGMSYERSTNYNRLVLELILVPILLLRDAGYEIPQDIWHRLESMFEFIMCSLKPDGKTPIVGDQDNGRLLPFGTEELIDFRYLLSLGAILFNRPDFKYYGNGYNLYCSLLGGENARAIWDNIPNIEISLKSKAFKDSGFYVFREKNNYLLFNASGKGLYPERKTGTHTHSDLLSFELCFKGKSFLVDPGSYVYTADAAQKMLFRSTMKHNTVVIDNCSQNVITKDKLWDFERNAIPSVESWNSDSIADKIEASHSGYMRLANPVRHKRILTFDKQEIKFTFVDEFTGSGIHFFQWFFHFDCEIDFEIHQNEIRTICKDGNNLLISFDFNQPFELKKEEAFVSKAYGEKQASLMLVVTTHCEAPLKTSFSISQIN